MGGGAGGEAEGAGGAVSEVVSLGGGKRGGYISARRTSPMGMTSSSLSLSSSRGSEKREKASRISASSCAVMPCSLASLEGRAPPALVGFAAEDDAPADGGRRRGGWG